MNKTIIFIMLVLFHSKIACPTCELISSLACRGMRFLMGRIKTKLIKRITHELIERYPDKFTDKYEENKKILGNIILTKSKKIRNAIAGYITRLKQTTS